MTAVDVKLDCLKYTILFTTADVCWLKNKTNACYQRMQKIGTEILFTPLLSFTLGWTIHPVKRHWSMYVWKCDN